MKPLILLYVQYAFRASFTYLFWSLLLLEYSAAATLTHIADYTSRPSSLEMYLYVPDSVVSNPPVLVAVHYCTGSGPAFHEGSQFSGLAEQYGFIVIYPSATRST
jgi:acetylxylan esterase